MITGKIRQIETMGLVDGPGIRVVVFMQGCPLRCLFCHNPEMWSYDGGTNYSSKELVNIILKYKNYFGEKGGVTFSGGEPLSQPAFLLDCLKLCKEAGINTCLDTSGIGNDQFNEEIVSLVDLIIYDIKALSDDKHRVMTNTPIDKSRKFLSLCQTLGKNLWIRSVIVPGINDTEEYIIELSNYIKGIKNVKKIELLPYHTMGKNKYDNLNIAYPLENVLPMDIEKCRELEEKLLNMLN